MAIPKGLDPTGIILVDKPEGPSSFAIVDRVRRRTGAKTGHAGTLDPFATGLLLLLSGRATKLAQRFSGLDKRYVTDIDLRSRTTTGDREGDSLGEHDPLVGPALDDALHALTGTIELPIPAASAVKIDGERAYRLHRGGRTVEMPIRRSQVYSLEPTDVRPGAVTLDLRVSAGTYIRAIADALGGHCRTLRRMEIGPFAVAEADEFVVIPAADALARLV